MARALPSLWLLVVLLPFVATAQAPEPQAPPSEANPADEAPQRKPLLAKPEPESDVAPSGTPLPLSPKAVSGDWLPPEPNEGEKEWIRLTTGEWLRGNIDWIEDDELQFDSAELDEVEIDWPKIAELRSSQVNTYRFEGRIIVTGTAGMKDGVIRIRTADGIREFEQAQLVGFIEGDLSELNFWSGGLSLGLAALSGNSNQKDISGSFDLKRETPLTRTYLRYLGVYATNEGTSDPNQIPLGETANNHRINTGFDLYLTRRLFLSLPVVEVYNDRFQNIALRVTPGLAVGYDALITPKVDWEVTGGLAYQYTKFNLAAPTPADPDPAQSANDAAVVLSTTLETDPFKDIDWDTIFSAQLIATDFNKTNLHLETTLSVEIWGPLDLDLGFVWNYIVKPELTESVTTGVFYRPVSNDIRITIGLGLDW
jgi:hypothetical protein